MKKLLSFTIIIIMLFSFSACSDTASVSNKTYNEISSYVKTYAKDNPPSIDYKFYSFKSSGLAIGSVYYGYYFTENNELLIPDFYNGDDLDKIKNDLSKNNGGTYFGKPNNGTDWCFVKKITNNWYYYELHWS